MTLCPASRCGCSFDSDTLEITRAADGRVSIELPDAYEFAYPIFSFLDDDERDATITNPQEGMEAFLRSEFSKYRYIDGDWRLIDRPGTLYTPTLTSLALGAGGTITAQYAVAGGVLSLWYQVTLGTGFSISGNPQYSVPIVPANPENVRYAGKGVCFDESTSRMWTTSGEVFSGIRVLQYLDDGVSTYPISSTSPFTWVAGDQIWGSFSYPLF